jgi:hypothetical protein
MEDEEPTPGIGLRRPKVAAQHNAVTLEFRYSLFPSLLFSHSLVRSLRLSSF